MSPTGAAPAGPDSQGRYRRKPMVDTEPRVANRRLIAIVVLAIIVRVIAWHGAVQIASDGADYLWQAQRLQAGDVAAALDHPYPPFYALTIAAGAFFTGDLTWAGAWVSIVAGVLAVLAVHGLARLALPDRRDVACGAALIAALYPPLVLATSNVTPDGLFVALFLIAMRLLFAGEQSGKLRLRLFGVGVFLGLAWLTRSETIFLLIPVAGWLVVGLVRRESRRHRPLPPRGLYLGAAALCALGLSLSLVPYSVLVRGLSNLLRGDFTHVAIAAPPDSPLGSPSVGVPRQTDAVPRSWLSPDTQRVVAALGGRVATPVTSDAPRITWAELTGQPPADGGVAGETTGAGGDVAPARKPPRRPIQRFALAAQVYFAAYSQAVTTLGQQLGLDVLLLAAIGLPVVLRRRAALLTLVVLLLAAWLALAAAQLMTRGALLSRDLLGPALLVLPVAGAGVAWLWGETRRFPRRPQLARSVGRAIVVLVLALAGVSLVSAIFRPDGKARLQALAWVREHSVPGERIAVIERRDGWYAERPILAVGRAVDGPELTGALKSHDVRLLVQPVDELTEHAPELLDGRTLIERARFGEGADAVVVLERPAG